jgi:hypothetical protein
VLWAIYCLAVFPKQIRISLVRDATKPKATCYEGGPSGEEQIACLKIWDDLIAAENEEWSFPGYFQAWWPYILGALTIIPAIIYGLCRLLRFIFMWVYSSFNPA